MPVIDIGTGVDTSDMKVRTYLYTSESMDSCVIFDSSFSKEVMMFKVVFNVNAGNGPEIASFALIRYFQGISSCKTVLFFHVGEGEAYSWLSIFDADLEVDAEVFLGCC